MTLNIIITLLTQLFSLLTPDYVKKMVDSGLNSLEDHIAKSGNANEIGIVLPLIDMLRQIVSIPDTHPLQSPLIGASPTTNMVITVLEQLFKLVPISLVKKMIDSGLDVIENSIAKNPTENALISPIILMFRKTFDIPDDDPQTAVITAPATTTATDAAAK